MAVNADLLLYIFKDHHDILLGLFGTPIIDNEFNKAVSSVNDLVLVLKHEMKNNSENDKFKLDEHTKYLWQLLDYTCIEQDFYEFSNWLQRLEIDLKNFKKHKKKSIEQADQPIKFFLELFLLYSNVSYDFEITDEETRLRPLPPHSLNTFYIPPIVSNSETNIATPLFIYKSLRPKDLTDPTIKLSDLIALNNQLVPLLRAQKKKYNHMISIINHNGSMSSGIHLNLAIKRYIDQQLYPPISLTEFQYLRDMLIKRLRQIAPNLEYAWILKNEACKGLNLHLLLSNAKLKTETDIIWGELTKGRGVICDMTPFNQLFRGHSISLLALSFLAPMFENKLPNSIGLKVRTYATNKK